MTTRRSSGSRPVGPSPSGWSISVDPGPMIGTYEPQTIERARPGGTRPLTC
jgi:hypothetical protein